MAGGEQLEVVAGGEQQGDGVEQQVGAVQQGHQVHGESRDLEVVAGGEQLVDGVEQQGRGGTIGLKI